MKDNVIVFPNPALEVLNIQFENSSITLLSVFDVYGKQVVERMKTNDLNVQLPIEHLTQGMYFLKIEMDEGELIKKFSKM